VRAGVMVDLVSVDDNGMLHVQYQGAPKEIPAAATDVLERSEGGMAANVQAVARAEEARSQFNLSFLAADGTPVDISRLRGHVVLVDFWATWYPACMEEVPYVAATYRKYHDQGFDIIGISLDQDRTAMLAVTQAQGMTWPQYFDGRDWENRLVTSFGIHSVPTMWLVNKKGVLVNRDVRDDLDSEVAKLLAE